MARYSLHAVGAPLAFWLLVVGSPVGTLGEAAAQDAAAAPAADTSRDHFIGWYELPKPQQTKHGLVPGKEALIPVFKRGGTYWTTSWGIEVPLKPCPDGLQWDLPPSTMEGTTIGFDEASKSYYIVIEDQYLKDTSQWEDGPAVLSGVRQSLTKVEPPMGLLDATAEPPRSHDDFIGWYQFAWCPIFRYEIRKEGEKYLALGQMRSGPDPDDPWEPPRERHELVPIAGHLGFIWDSSLGMFNRLTYNARLQRFELTAEEEGRHPTVSRIPLVRVPTPPSSEETAVPPHSPPKLIGIHSSRG